MFDLSSADPMPHATSCDTRDRALPQSDEFAKALRLSGQTPLRLDRMQDMIVLRRKFWGRIPVAMINRADLTKPARLLEILQEEGMPRTPVLLSPERPTPELARLGALPLMTPASVAVLDLGGTRADLRARLQQKWRNRLNAAENANLRVTRQNMPIDPDHWLLRADSALQQTRGYRSWPTALTLAYAQSNPGQAKLFQAHLGNDIVAGVLILTHGDRATYHIAHSTEAGKAQNAHNLLMWSAMEWLAAKGCHSLDLGVINTEDAEGLARFKLGTGAELRKLGGTWLFWPPLGRRLAPLARLDLNLMRA
ncbi:GNAT family N-acetyltransferase [Epibacterium sp. SM1979]|uniref:GNAT family N-acetyltransferase n=1 Tax=Tritonibacter litoralis TaxID=2662264 RepID=A0A843Y843_9RHOB|nr:GNAT family N-acetyltransferase [Tritonibacter litoralis]MQQ07370.1 GNAT family N-acetyltransferase [Tritonibacter litoralis]